MAFDANQLLAMPTIETYQVLSARDSILYALGVGATDLRFVYEARISALPSMASTVAYPGFHLADPALGLDWRKIVHSDENVTLHRPLPAEGSFRSLTRHDALHDLGATRGALLRVVRELFVDGEAEPIATIRSGVMLRGDGGRGGDATRPPPPPPIPERAADVTVAMPSAPNQAQLYRLTGDNNPLHIDPQVAREAGFERPILHGLATFGIVARALLAELCDNDPARLAQIAGRFSAPVYPGETILVDIWRENGAAAFRGRIAERDIVIVNNGRARTRDAD